MSLMYAIQFKSVSFPTRPKQSFSRNYFTVLLKQLVKLKSKETLKA